METRPSDDTPASLAQQAAWIRRLALQLARDPEVAEDLAQETYRVALEQAPRHSGSFRGWLATVARNLHLQNARSESRRVGREQRAAVSEHQPAASDAVERIQTERLVSGAVLQLDEPYRSTLLMRFYENLPPRKIAARAGVPVSTVKTRLARGLAKLRERLDEIGGGNRDSWLMALIPIIAAPAAAPGPIVPWEAILVSSKMKIGAAVVIVAATASIVFWQSGGDTGDAPRAAEQAAAQPADLSPAPAAEGNDEPERREMAAPVPAVAAEPEVEAAPQRFVEGRAMLVTGEPLGGLKLQYEYNGPDKREDSPTAFSRADGTYTIGEPPVADYLRSGDAAYTTVLSPQIAAPHDSAYEPILVAAPTLRFAGRVVDEQGGPLEGASISVSLPTAIRARFSEILDASTTRDWQTSTGADGSFTLAAAPKVEGARLIIAKQGFNQIRLPLPEVSDEALLLTMLRRDEVDSRLLGQVFDAKGALAVDAVVTLGHTAVRTNARGEFEIFTNVNTEDFDELRAVSIGSLPALLEKPDPPENGPQGWPEYVALRLGGSPLKITGRVIDAEGEPVAGARVLVEGDDVFGNAADSSIAFVHEAVLGGAQSSNFRSDDDGRFEINGLSPRSYRIVAVDERTMLSASKEDVFGGTADLEIQMPGDDGWHIPFRGRVISNDGSPVEGVRITLDRTMRLLRLRGSTYANSNGPAAISPVTTDEQGYFEFDRVPQGVGVSVSGDSILPGDYDVPEAEKALHEIVVSSRCHLQVDASPGDPPAHGFQILDANERALTITVFEASSTYSSSNGSLENGRSAVVSTSDLARWIVWTNNNEEIARKRIRLNPQEVTRITP